MRTRKWKLSHGYDARIQDRVWVVVEDAGIYGYQSAGNDYQVVASLLPAGRTSLLPAGRTSLLPAALTPPLPSSLSPPLDMEAASVQLQSVMRAKLDRKRVNLLRDKRIKKWQTTAAIVIQRCERGKWGRNVYKMMIRKEQEEAITRIQARIRLKRGRLESEQKKKVHQRKRRGENGQIAKYDNSKH